VISAFSVLKGNMLNHLTYTHKIVLAFVSGLLGALAYAPLFWWPALFVSITALYWLVAASKSAKARFGLGWAYGFGSFLAGLYWIGNALLVEGNDYIWAYPLAVIALPAALAFFPALAIMATRWAFPLSSTRGYLFFAAVLALSEWLRGHLFTGFPWNLSGYIWGGWLAIAQIIHFSDVYTLSLLTLLWAALPGYLLVAPKSKTAVIAACLVLISFGSVWFYGQQRLAGSQNNAHDNIAVSLIQPNIPQADKWDGDKMAAHFRRYLEMSAPSSLPPPESTKPRIHLIIWPETALNYWFLDNPEAMQAIADMLQSYEYEDAYLLSGALRRDSETGAYANSLVMIDDTGQILNTYDKHHLVPFGEYIPFQDIIPLKPVVQFTGFQKGSGAQYVELPGSEGLSYSPQICYESIFPGKAIKNDEPLRPDFLLNVTNDAWYGNSPGPYQHFTQARFRSIEQGTPLLRAANTGITAIISPYGEIFDKTELFTQKKMTSLLPAQINNANYLYPIKYLLSPVFILFFCLFGIYKNKPATQKN